MPSASKAVPARIAKVDADLRAHFYKFGTLAMFLSVAVATLGVGVADHSPG